MKAQSLHSEEVSKKSAEKPVSLAPLTTTQALRSLLQIKPMKNKATKKQTAKAKSEATKKNDKAENKKA